MNIHTIAPCLWFDDQAEAAAKFYVSVFKDAKILRTTKYPNVGQETHGRPAGSVMTVEIQLNGVRFTLLNGGPMFKFNEAVSLQVFCETQQEIDYYWDKLIAGGGQEGPCGWCKDKYGLSWQISTENQYADDPVKSERALGAILKMKKFDIAALEKAVAGK